MPMTRHNSGSALNRGHTHFSTFDSSYSDEKQSSVYRSSPDLSQVSHRRYSSTDSVDSSHNSGHSRQGSETNEKGYPTRRMSSALSRKSSTSADPLQFIKAKGAQELAHTAQVQMRVAAECKKVSPHGSRTSSEDDAGWQANLSSWKSRRKSQSERSWALKEQLEAMEKEKEGNPGTALPQKTFSQMQEERVRRQSLPNRKFYPIEDDEDDAFLPSDSTAGPGQSATDTSTKSNFTPWANNKEDVDGEEEEEEEEEKEEMTKSKSTGSLHQSAPHASSFNDRNNNDGSTSKISDKSSQHAPYSRSSSRSKLLDRYKEIDDEDSNDFFSKTTPPPESSQSFSSSSSSSRTRRSGVQGMSEDSEARGASVSTSSKKSDWRAGGDGTRGSSFNKAKDAFSKGDSSERDGVSSSSGVGVRATSGSVGPRNQSKIGSILKNFEQSESKAAMPKQGYNEKIDLSDRKKMFEKPLEDSSPARPVSSSGGYLASRKFGGGRSSEEFSGDSDYTSSDERKSSSNYSKGYSNPGMDISSSKYESSADSGVKEYSTNGADSSREYSSTSGRSELFLDTSKGDRTNDESLDQEEGVADSFSRSDYHSASATPSSLSSSSLAGPSSAGTVYASARTSGKDYVEKTIRISQKANSDKGFGFILSGGLDKGEPLTVSKVHLGSAADVCELRAQDRVLSVNNRDVSAFTAMEVGDVVAKAVTTGYIEIRVKRLLGDEDEEEEDFTESSDEGEEDTSSPGYRATQQQTPFEEPTASSIQSQLQAEREWLEAQMRDAEEEEEEEQEETDGLSPPMTPQTESGHQVAVESRQTITLGPPPPPEEEEPIPPPPPSTTQAQQSLQQQEQAEDSDGPGPPAILRKWQRQRQKDEYTFDAPSDPSTTSPLYRKISLNASLPRRDSDAAEEATGQSKVQTTLNTRLTRPWDERLDEWTRQQDEQRQPGSAESWSRKQEPEQAHYEAEKDRIRQQYEEDIREAERKETQRLQKEQEMLQPEMEKARLLEERRAERRARIQKEALGATSTPSPYDHAIPPLDNGTAASGDQETHVTSMRFNLSQSHLQPQESVGTLYGQQSVPQHYGRAPLNSGQGNVIIIDPRNRQNQMEPGKPVEFQVKLGQQQDPNTAALLEAERERIRLEELQKIEEGRRRKAEEEERAREEEMRRIREKEEQLQQKEEMLRKQREQFLREQEEFKRLQEQQLRQHQQQHQLQQQQHHQDQLPPPHDAGQTKEVTNGYTPQRSPSPYAPVPFHPPRTTADTVRSASGQLSNPGYSSSTSQPAHYQPYQNSNDSRAPQAVHQSQHRVGREPQPSSTASHPRWPPAENKSSTSHNNGDARAGKRFSRDEMLAMNRKATPMQASPRQAENRRDASPRQMDNRRDASPYQQRNVIREQLPTGDPSTINSAPRAKLRDDTGWYGQNQKNINNHSNSSQGTPRQQPIQPQSHQARSSQPPWEQAKQRGGGGGGNKFSFAGPGDHWLIQEAERRRVAESEGRLNPPKGSSPRGHSPNTHFSGPIKPAADLNNRWRENNGYREDSNPRDGDYLSPSMPAAIRQTLLQKTASARGPSSSPEQLSPHHLSPTSSSPLPDSHPYSSSREASPHPPRGGSYHQPPQQKHHPPPQQQQYYQGPPKQGSYPPAPGQQVDPDMAVSGAQLCSQCNQELGFGAAMVIESLNLYFHVTCFRCCVCHASLGTGSQGADVRVRMNKLHCPNCYSNDEAGLKFSKV